MDSKQYKPRLKETQQWKNKKVRTNGTQQSTDSNQHSPEGFPIDRLRTRGWGIETDKQLKPTRTMQCVNKNTKKRMDSPIDIRGI